MKGIFSKKAFWFTLVALLFAACIYPPFFLMTEEGMTMGRKWDWIFTLPTPQEVPRIDLAMLFVEAIIAILIAIGISSIVLGLGKVSKQTGLSRNRAGKPDNGCSGGTIG